MLALEKRRGVGFVNGTTRRNELGRGLARFLILHELFLGRTRHLLLEELFVGVAFRVVRLQRTVHYFTVWLVTNRLILFLHNLNSNFLSGGVRIVCARFFFAPEATSTTALPGRRALLTIDLSVMS